MQEPIEDYPLVNTQYNSELRAQLVVLSKKLEELISSPETQLNQILNEELRRIKSRSHNCRHKQHNKIQVLEVKKKIHSLKREVRSLKCREPTIKRNKRSTSVEPPLEYSVIKKELEIKNQIYNQQKERSQLQKKQISSIKNAIQQLDQKILVSYNSEDFNAQDQNSLNVGLSKKMKFLHSRKKQLLKMKSQVKSGYEIAVKQRIDSLMTIEQTKLERQLLEKKINRDISLQEVIIKQMREESGLSQNQCENQSVVSRVSKINRKFLTRQRISDTQIDHQATNQPYKSIEDGGAYRVKQKVKNFQTLSTDHTPLRYRPQPSIISKRRHSFRSPINLNPCPYKMQDVVNQHYLSSSLGNELRSPKRTPYMKKGSIHMSHISEIKLNQTSNFDISMTSSMYNKCKGIELVNQSFVELSTIKEEGRKRQISKVGMISTDNRGRLAQSKMNRFSKASISETTKQQLTQDPKALTNKGVPFECDQISQSNHSFNMEEGLSHQVPRRSIRAPVFSVQQF